MLCSGSESNQVYTLGYAGRDLPELISILKLHGIQLVVDVRRFPSSKYPGFSRQQLESCLAQNGIDYLFMGDLLGGFRKGYLKHMCSPEYKLGIQRIRELAAKTRLALLCREKSQRYCHRRYISWSLEQLGIQLVHLE